MENAEPCTSHHSLCLSPGMHSVSFTELEAPVLRIVLPPYEVENQDQISTIPVVESMMDRVCDLQEKGS